MGSTSGSVAGAGLSLFSISMETNVWIENTVIIIFHSYGERKTREDIQ